MNLWNVAFLLFLGLLVIAFGQNKNCVKNGPCSCAMSDGSGTIDISGLGNKDGAPL